MKFLKQIRFTILFFYCKWKARLIVRASRLKWPGCEGAKCDGRLTGANPTTGYIAQGEATTIRWGTNGVVSTTGFLEVISARQRRKKEDFDLGNGNGQQSGRIQLQHGLIWEVQVRDDTAMTNPIEFTSVTISDMAGHFGTAGAMKTATVITSDYDAAPKKPGERTLTLERILLIEGGA